MSIVGVGVDIEDVARFENEDGDRLLDRLFTEAERGYCFSKARPARHFAARFAAKEATVKALCHVLPKLLVTQVELYKEPDSQAPLVRLISGAELPEHMYLHVSLSHTGDHATAFVIAEMLKR